MSFLRPKSPFNCLFGAIASISAMSEAEGGRQHPEPRALPGPGAWAEKGLATRDAVRSGGQRSIGS